MASGYQDYKLDPPDLSEFNKTFTKAEKTTDSFAKKFVENMKKITASSKAANTSSALINKSLSYEKQYNKVVQLKKAVEDYNNTLVKHPAIEALDKQYDAMFKQQQKLQENIRLLKQIGEWKPSSTSAKKMLQQFENLKVKMEKIADEETRIAKNTPDGEGLISKKDADPEAYAKITKQLDEAWKRAQALNISLQQTKAKVQSASGATTLFSVLVGKLKSEFGSVFNLISRATKTWTSTMSGTVKAGGKVAGFMVKGVTDVSGSIQDEIKKIAKFLLKYGLGIKSIYLLWKRLKRYVIAALEDMGAQVPEVQAQLDELSSSFNTFKASMGTAVQPIFTVLEPALVSMTNTLINACNAVAKFIATLTGQGYIYKAKKANSSYAKSVADTGKAAKEANKELAQYDKLIVINKDNADSGGSGGVGDDGGAGAGYEKVNIDPSDSVAKFAKQVKDAWAKADFTDVGATIAQKLATTLDNIPWEGIQATAAKIGRSIGTLINGFVTFTSEDGQTIGMKIGNFLAQCVNTGIQLLSGLINSIDLGAIGTFIGQIIVTGLNNIQWDTIYKDMGTLGVKLAQGFNSFLDTGVLESIGQSVAKLFNSGINLGANLVTNFKFDKLGDHIGKAISDMFTNINWKRLGTNTGGLIKGLLTAMTHAVAKVDWEEVGQDIADYLANLDLPGIFKKTTKLIKTVADAFIALVQGLTSNKDVDKQLIKIGAALAGLLVAKIALGLVGEAAIATLKEALLTAMGGSFTLGGLGKGAISLLTAFGGSVMGPVGAAIITAIAGFKLGNALYDSLAKDKDGNNALDIFVEWAAKLIKKLKEKFDNLKDGVKTTFTNLKDDIKALFKKPFEIKFDIMQKVSDVKTWLNKHMFDPINSALSKVPVIGDFIDKHPLGLAKGAVIPPNREFMAILGDQKQGVNIETPLNTMIDAFNTALNKNGYSNNHQPIVLQLDGTTVAQCIWDREKKAYKQAVNNGGVGIIMG